MAFWRRTKGRHALGAAVTALRALPAPALEPVRRFGGSVAAPAPATAAVPLQPVHAPMDWSFPELHGPAQGAQPTPSGPRVELTFRDGTSASLDPTAARALDEIAQVLTRRD